MNRANPPPRPAEPQEVSEDDLDTEDVSNDDLDEEDTDAPDDLSEETGIDLTDASDLDADNVPADEEFDRVMQAPD